MYETELILTIKSVYLVLIHTGKLDLFANVTFVLVNYKVQCLNDFCVSSFSVICLTVGMMRRSINLLS